MLKDILSKIGLINYFTEIISVEEISKYKPAGEVYKIHNFISKPL